VSKETKRWPRRKPDRRENLLTLSTGLGVALVVGGSVSCPARLLAAREALRVASGRAGFAPGRPGER